MRSFELKLQRWLPSVALVVVAACNDDVTSAKPQAGPQFSERDVCYITPSCGRSPLVLVTDARGTIGTGTVAVVLLGSEQIDASAVKLGATRIQLFINESAKPVTYNQGSIVSFVQQYGMYRLNMNLASMATDTIGTRPPPPPPVYASGILRDFDGDGRQDIAFFFPVYDLVKGGLQEGMNSIVLRASGAGITGSVSGGNEVAATDSIGTRPPPPPPIQQTDG